MYGFFVNSTKHELTKMMFQFKVHLQNKNKNKIQSLFFFVIVLVFNECKNDVLIIKQHGGHYYHAIFNSFYYCLYKRLKRLYTHHS